jgi:site-specific recombinase XerD
MTPFHKRQTPITKRMAEDMLVRNLAIRTIDTYTYHVDRFAKHFGKLPEDLGPEQIREFQLWMIQVKGSSWSQFQCATHPKHRAVLLTLYAAGLRLSEATNLKIPDIDSQRMQLKVNGGKGGKDRYVPISPRLLEELRTYWKHDRPTSYLFPGKTADVPLSSATIQKACKMAAAQARINKIVTPHTLRHSYATGLLEAGVDLMAISKLLGHSSFVTTMIYLHCRRQHLGMAPSPLDWLPTRQCPRWVDPSLQASKPTAPPPDQENRNRH